MDFNKSFYELSKEEYDDMDIAEWYDTYKKYKKLEEQVSCPLEVKCKICTGRLVYLPNGKAYLVAGVRDSYFTVRIEDGCTETIDNKEYGISWWFKPDRSE